MSPDASEASRHIDSRRDPLQPVSPPVGRERQDVAGFAANQATIGGQRPRRAIVSAADLLPRETFVGRARGKEEQESEIGKESPHAAHRMSLGGDATALPSVGATSDPNLDEPYVT